MNESANPGPNVIGSPEEMYREVMRARCAGQTVGVVPTMGALHEGHLSLVQASKQACDRTVVTIFVNPTQFGPGEDFSKYPRDLAGDLARLAPLEVDWVFAPPVEVMYPPGAGTFVDPPAVAEPWEGHCRPVHFRGVATIVLKLFQIIPADVAFFGQKDYQQVAVVRQMVADLNVPVRIETCPTVREADGLAMSSRNAYLDPDERRRALGLSRALERAARLVEQGERRAAVVQQAMHEELAVAGAKPIDYAVLADPVTLAQVETIQGDVVALIAAFVGKTRLIDNRVISLK